MDNPLRLTSKGRRKFLIRKCPAECGEKGIAIVVALLILRMLPEVTALPPSSVVVFVSYNSPVLCLCVCVRCVSGVGACAGAARLSVHFPPVLQGPPSEASV